MQARMADPAQTVPNTLRAMTMLGHAARRAGVPETTHHLIHLRASQINGCSVCVEMHSRELEQDGLPLAKIFAVPAWRESPYFTEAERAALDLTEAVTRLADRPDPVSDEVWNEAARLYDEEQLASLVVSIATINAWNRMKAATRQIAGEWVERLIAPATATTTTNQATASQSG